MSLSQDTNDEDLMALISDGDHQAFSILVQRHTERFYRLAFRMCGRKEDAEDIVQESFVKLWNKREQWDPSRGAKFTTWFYRVVSNGSLDYLRKKKPVSSDVFVDLAEDETPRQDKRMENMQEEEMIEAAIQDLPERQRMALNLCFYEGISNKEAADIMGVGVKALESLLMRAKKSLKDRLVTDNGEIKEVRYG